MITSLRVYLGLRCREMQTQKHNLLQFAFSSNLRYLMISKMHYFRWLMLITSV